MVTLCHEYLILVKWYEKNIIFFFDRSLKSQTGSGETKLAKVCLQLKNLEGVGTGETISIQEFSTNHGLGAISTLFQMLKFHGGGISHWYCSEIMYYFTKTRGRSS